MRHDTDFGVRQLRIALDAVDQRGAARRRGEQPLENHQIGLLLHDRLQRLDRFRIRIGEDLPVDLDAVAQGGHEILRSNHERGRRHSVSLA
jgi:hypothetical protein